MEIVNMAKMKNLVKNCQRFDETSNEMLKRATANKGSPSSKINMSIGIVA